MDDDNESHYLRWVSSAIFLGGLGAVGYKYAQSNQAHQVITNELEGKLAIVTGANSGIGKESALQLAARGAQVILACRNNEQCELTRQLIEQKTGNRWIRCLHLDLLDANSIRSFARRVKKCNILWETLMEKNLY